jgi:hypothetical protein
MKQRLLLLAIIMFEKNMVSTRIKALGVLWLREDLVAFHLLGVLLMLLLQLIVARVAAYPACP